MKLLKSCIFITVLSSVFATADAAEPDWGDFAQLLNRHVSYDSPFGIELAQVDYPRIKTDPLYNKVITLIADYPVSRLSSREERLSFYINAYNILAIKMVIDHWPINSIKDAGGFFTSVWKMPVGVIDGKTVTLDEIEHKILRPMGEPRIHMAIVCASVSCPDLRPEPYTADQLHAQLDDQIQRFLNNQGKGLRIEAGVIMVSKIFDWFEEDFSQYGNVAGFIRRYRSDLPAKLSIKPDIDYNWSLNYTGNKL